MIKQTKLGLTSVSETNPYKENGFLPLITAPNLSVVDETNYKSFLRNNIHVCFPEKVEFEELQRFMEKELVFKTVSLEELYKLFVEGCTPDKKLPYQQVCINTTNGNNPLLHSVIKQAKEIHGNNLIIMAGNVGSVEAFVELAKTGVDYIRVGIDTLVQSNIGIGYVDLEKLIELCNYTKMESKSILDQISQEGYYKIEKLTRKEIIMRSETYCHEIIKIDRSDLESGRFELRI